LLLLFWEGHADARIADHSAGVDMAERPTGARIALTIGVAAAGVVVAGAVAAAGLASVMARKVITPPRVREEDIRILAYTERAITLSATEDSLTPGRYGLWFTGDTGYLRMGAILSSDGETVTRELLSVAFGNLAAARRGRLSGWFHLHPSELGVPVEDVQIQAPVGLAPAWLVPAENATDNWVIQVHGRAVTRAEGIRAIPVFRAAGYTTLLVSYRNDGVAPDTADRRYALGSTEWRDVEAAIDYAVDRGAKNIVLMGWSMGGATSLQTSMLSRHRDRFRGLVLESPAVDWYTILDFHAAQQRVPYPVRIAALRLLSSRWGKPFTGQAEPIDLDSLNIVRRAHELTLPTLLMHSADDGYVPADAARELALLRPDLVQYDEWTVARHAKLWNYDPERFDRLLTEWLASLGKPSARTSRPRRRAAAAPE
jgi:uncharacterized protein